MLTQFRATKAEAHIQRRDVAPCWGVLSIGKPHGGREVKRSRLSIRNRKLHGPKGASPSTGDHPVHVPHASGRTNTGARMRFPRRLGLRELRPKPLSLLCAVRSRLGRLCPRPCKPYPKCPPPE